MSCPASLAARAAYGHSWQRLSDIIDGTYGLQEVMSPESLMTFLDCRLTEERQRVARAMAELERAKKDLVQYGGAMPELQASVVARLRATIDLLDGRRQPNDEEAGEFPAARRGHV